MEVKISNHFNKKIAGSIVAFSVLTFQPTISFAKEDPVSNFFTKMFSSKSATANQSNKTQIFNADINSLNISSVFDLEYTIQDILKNYFDKTTVNKVLNSISDKDDKSIKAKDLAEFNKILPQSKNDKINGSALIRIANQLGKDKESIFEIKKKIIFQIVKSQGLNLTFNDKAKKPVKIEAKKEDEIDIKEASSMGWIAALAGVGLAGGGGGGSSSKQSVVISGSK